MNYKQLVEHKIERLRTYKATPGAKLSTIQWMENEINTMIDQFNAVESYIISLEKERDNVTNLYLKAKAENESLKRRLMFYHESAIIDGYEQSIHQLHTKIQSYGYKN